MNLGKEMMREFHYKKDKMLYQQNCPKKNFVMVEKTGTE